METAVKLRCAGLEPESQERPGGKRELEEDKNLEIHKNLEINYGAKQVRSVPHNLNEKLPTYREKKSHARRQVNELEIIIFWHFPAYEVCPIVDCSKATVVKLVGNRDMK